MLRFPASHDGVSAGLGGFLRQLALRHKIGLFVAVLLLLSLVLTAAVIGVKSSRTALSAAQDLALARTQEAANAVQARIGANLSGVRLLARAVERSSEANQALARDQVDEAVRALLDASPDFIGAAVTMEPNALDGRDAEFADKKPRFDATGRHMPYWTRRPDGSHNVEPIVFGPKPGDNDWYEVPKRTRKLFFMEPYVYPIEGKPVLMASLVVPILGRGEFRGTASGDFSIEQLGKLLAELRTLDGGRLTLLSNGGLYATHQDPERLGKAAEDLPKEALAAIAAGQGYAFELADQAHVCSPMRIHADLPAWSVCMDYPLAVAKAPARELLLWALGTAAVFGFVSMALLLARLRRMMRPLNELARAMQDLSTGDADLRQRLTVRSRDELGQIAEGFNGFVEKVNGSLLQIRDTASAVQLASGEIASGNTDLSQRTEQAAANLQKTASAMDQIASTVGHTAQTAEQAAKLAADASQVALRGGNQVAGVVQTMNAIQQSSKRIADIIGTIDGIAFQTNILALNAAVEAARAGEQGRGFAVVAGEVRLLAGRSAEAAKEIKQLIHDSVERVSAGASQVAQTGGTMQEAVQAAERVAALVGDISTATREQSSGVQEVNGSIAVLDQMTQQNAALVEQSSAAALSLREQADGLAQVVASFRLSERSE